MQQACQVIRRESFRFRFSRTARLREQARVLVNVHAVLDAAPQDWRGCGSEEGSYLRRIDSCITQLKVQGPSRTCNESAEEEGSHARDAAHQDWRGCGSEEGSHLRLIDFCITQL